MANWLRVHIVKAIAIIWTSTHNQVSTGQVPPYSISFPEAFFFLKKVFCQLEEIWSRDVLQDKESMGNLQVRFQFVGSCLQRKSSAYFWHVLFSCFKFYL